MFKVQHILVPLSHHVTVLLSLSSSNFISKCTERRGTGDLEHRNYQKADINHY